MWKPIRQFLNDIHLYAGLLSAVIVIAVCFTGTLYVYNTEIREFFDSERYFASGQGTPKTLEELKSGLQPLQKGIGSAWRLETVGGCQILIFCDGP